MDGLTKLVLSYLIGSVPFGLVVAFLVKRIDIRKHGSGNIGATNVVRVAGKNWGILVFILDFLKGFIAPLIIVATTIKPTNTLLVLSVIAVVVGHNFPVFLKFKGGKGVSTSVGAIAGLSIILPKLWIVLIVAISIWIGTFLLSRYVSLASLLSALGFFLLCLGLGLPIEIKVFSLLLFILIVLRHKNNIQRLLHGRENRF